MRSIEEYKRLEDDRQGTVDKSISARHFSLKTPKGLESTGTGSANRGGECGVLGASTQDRISD